MYISGRTKLGLFFLTLGLLLLYESYTAELSLFSIPGEMPTMLYPRALLFGWLALSCLYILNPEKPFNAQELRASIPGVSKVVASIALYIILFDNIGLLLATFIFLLTFFYIMQYRNIYRTVPYALLGGVLTWFVFEKVLGAVLPQPFWIGMF